MANLTTVLREEIRRQARRELNTQLEATKKTLSRHRGDLVQLKKQLRDQTQKIKSLEQQLAKKASGAFAMDMEAESLSTIRFSPRWVKSHREKLGLSAADYGKLIGVTQLSVYNWEHGKSRPRAKQLSALSEIRGLGKREAQQRLEEIVENK